MGVKDLWRLLEDVAEPCTLSELEEEVVAVDLSGWICQSGLSPALQGRIRKPHLRNLFWRVYHLLRNQVKPVFITEGTAPDLKHKELEKRRAVRAKKDEFTPSKLGKLRLTDNGDGPSQQPVGPQFQEKIDECCELLDYMGVPYIKSPGEAEALCAALSRAGIVEGCITDDGDTFLFGAKVVYKNFTCDENKADFSCYRMEKIESELKLTREKLIALAMLVGCDYTPGVQGIGKEQGLKWLQGLNRQEDVFKRFEKWKTDREYYEKIEEIKNIKKPTHCGQCDHPGSSTQHKSKGCSVCTTSTGCTANSPKVCFCEWHLADTRYKDMAGELKIRRQALLQDSFPVCKVIEEFRSADTFDTSMKLQWKCPDFEKLQQYLHQQLGWEPDVIYERVIPIVISYGMTNPAELPSVQQTPTPKRIIKKRTLKGIEKYEVEWTPVAGSPSPVSTIETKEMISKHFPRIVEDYNCQEIKHRLAKEDKSKRRRTQRTPVGQRKITSMFRATKGVKRKLTYDQGDGDDIASSKMSGLCDHGAAIAEEFGMKPLE